MRRLAAAAVGAAGLLVACGQGGGDAPARPGAPAADAGSAVDPSRPWDVSSEAGLWRIATIVDGRPAASRLRCHAGGPLLPAPVAGCERPRLRATEAGFTREARCEGVATTTTVTGSLSSGFSAVTRAGDSETLATYLRISACPDGWRAGEVREEGAATAPPRAPAAAGPRRPSAGAAPAISQPPVIEPPPLPAEGELVDPTGEADPDALPPLEEPPKQED